MIGSRLSGVGVALPAREVTNDEIAAQVGVDDTWIHERTGIRARRVASPKDTAASLGASAARRSLAVAGVDAGSIDVIVCATITPDFRFPATACSIQALLGARAAAFDLNAGCSGFLFGLAQADALVRAGAARTVLVVGTEILSRITDPKDRSTAILFGDGAGAVVVERSSEPGLGPFALRSDGSHPEMLCVPPDEGVIRMRGREVYRAAVAGMVSAAEEVLHATGNDVGDIDLLIAHQANGRIVSAVADRLGAGPEKVFTNMERLGNTSAASIPLALYDAQTQGRLKHGDRVMLAAFGAGFCWGAGLMSWLPSALAGNERDEEMAHV